MTFPDDHSRIRTAPKTPIVRAYWCGQSLIASLGDPKLRGSNINTKLAEWCFAVFELVFGTSGMLFNDINGW